MFEQDNSLDLIVPILLDNKFLKVSGDNNTFKNEKCTIEIDLEDEVYNLYYRDKNNVNYMVTSDNFNLYWLFRFNNSTKTIQARM